MDAFICFSRDYTTLRYYIPMFIIAVLVLYLMNIMNIIVTINRTDYGIRSGNLVDNLLFVALHMR